MEIVQKLIVEVQRLTSEGRTTDAIYLLEKASVEILNFLGIIYHDQNMPNKAEIAMQAAINVDKSNWGTFSNLSHILNCRGLTERAKEAARKSVAFNDVDSLPCFNYGVILANLHLFEESNAAYREALRRKPDFPKARYNLACGLLSQGNFKEGWKEYESRFDKLDDVKSFRERFKQPTWNGSSSKKKKLCLFSEQGVGDLIQFSRYIPKARKLVKNIVLECQEEIATIMKQSFPDIEVIGRAGDPYPSPPSCDMVASVCSLPYILGLDHPQKCEYLKELSKPIELPIKFNIGFSWAGNPNHPLDESRSCHCQRFSAFTEYADLYSLQVGGNPRWKGDFPFVDLSDKLHDFNDTANYLRQLDLVITIDSGLAHLCGAMGVPCWVLIPFNFDWRWNTEWYNSIRLFRQSKMGDWDSVFQDVIKELAQVQKHQGLLNCDDKTGSKKLCH